jgi:unsaturated chondroitin disaccharide hydrolase
MTSLLSDEYLSLDKDHEGLLLHSIYHQPNGWDYIKEGQRVPNGESSLWGDYHILEAGLYLQKIIKGDKYLTFYDI